MFSIIDLLNPCSPHYHRLEDFKGLSGPKQVLVLTLSIFAGLLTLGVGVTPFFRILVNKLDVKKNQPENPLEKTAKKIEEVNENKSLNLSKKIPVEKLIEAPDITQNNEEASIKRKPEEEKPFEQVKELLAEQHSQTDQELLKIILDKESLYKQVDALVNALAENSSEKDFVIERYQKLYKKINTIIEKAQDIQAFLSIPHNSGRIGKNHHGNNTGFSYMKTDSAIFIHIPGEILRQGKERRIHFAINLSSGELVVIMKVLDVKYGTFAGDGLIHHRCPNNKYLLNHYNFEKYISAKGVEKKLVYAKLYLGDASNIEKLSAKEFLSYAYSIAKGIEALHEENLTHNDIKLENLFLTGDPKIPVVLGDFGCVNDWMDVSKKIPAFQGTVSTMAPERMNDAGQEFDFKKHSAGDIYSFGAVLCLLYKRYYLPYDTDGLYVNDIKCLCKSLLAKNPNERPSIKEVIKTLEFLMQKEEIEKN